MTTAHPTVEQVRGATLRDLVRNWGTGLAARARALRASVAAMAAGGQLGPGPEVEAGRWTGARV